LRAWNSAFDQRKSFNMHCTYTHTRTWTLFILDFTEYIATRQLISSRRYTLYLYIQHILYLWFRCILSTFSGSTGVSPIHVGPGFSSKFLQTDVEYLHCIALDRSIHGDSWLEMAIRGPWIIVLYLPPLLLPLAWDASMHQYVPGHSSARYLSNQFTIHLPRLIWLVQFTRCTHSLIQPYILTVNSELGESQISDAAGSDGNSDDISWSGKTFLRLWRIFETQWFN
jgi:hypothetical protein